MMNFFTPLEAVDPNLQAIALRVLHWCQTSPTSWELRQPAEPHLDGFGKAHTVVGRIIFDTESQTFRGEVAVTDAPPLPIRFRYLLPMAQEELLGVLTSQQRP